MAHIATGDILREALRLGTPMGQLAKPYMEQGKYVPDEVVNGIVAERLSAPDRPESFLMDGYPRTLAQAVALDQVLSQHKLNLHAVVVLDVPDDEIVRRITGRRVCPKDGSLYHIVSKPPKVAGHCDLCGSVLEHRADDQESTIRERLRVFRATMPAVTEHYRKQGLVREVNGTGAIEAISEAVLHSLGIEERSC
jgi:adenylate kinase